MQVTRSRYRILESQGFSLVELMIAVAMIGVLAALSVASFDEFAKRARFSQAKSGLADLYKAEMIFRGEWNQFTSRFDALNYQYTGNLFFNIGFDNDFAPPVMAPQGTAGCNTFCGNTAGPGACPASFRTWTCTTLSNNGLDGADDAFVFAATFKGVAHSHLSPSSIDWYSFSIDQSKSIRQVNPAN